MNMNTNTAAALIAQDYVDMINRQRPDIWAEPAACERFEFWAGVAEVSGGETLDEAWRIIDMMGIDPDLA